MKISDLHQAALLALLLGACAAAPAKAPRARSAAPAPVATVGDRHVEAADIQRAALVLNRDPLRTKRPAAWRRKLLDVCVDRELLAAEAERKRFADRPDVHRRIERATSDYLYGEIRDRYLVPGMMPNAAQLDTARAGGLYRRVKIAMILTLTDTKTVYDVFQELKHGARFDSMAAALSVLPSAPKGGEVGWKHVGELNAASWHAFKTAKPGDLMGPYENDASHEFYKVEALEEPSDQEIRDLMAHDRTVQMESRYTVDLFTRYHFRMKPDAVSAVIFASATEAVDSILATLDERGSRPKRDIHPALGTIATVDGDSITYRDIAVPGIMAREEDGKSRIDDSRSLLNVCVGTLLPRLVARDAHERGVDRDPAVRRRVRLIREELSTRAMVAAGAPPTDAAAVESYFRAHAAAYQRPPAHRAFVAVFNDEDSARAALQVWNRNASRDSIFGMEGFRPTPRATARTLFARRYGEGTFFDPDSDPLSAAVRELKEGQISSLIPTANGYAIAQGLGSEPARPYTLDEVKLSAWGDAREAAENAWVEAELTRLRAATPARAVPSLLNAVRIGLVAETGGNRR